MQISIRELTNENHILDVSSEIVVTVEFEREQVELSVR